MIILFLHSGEHIRGWEGKLWPTSVDCLPPRLLGPTLNSMQKAPSPQSSSINLFHSDTIRTGVSVTPLISTMPALRRLPTRKEEERPQLQLRLRPPSGTYPYFLPFSLARLLASSGQESSTTGPRETQTRDGTGPRLLGAGGTSDSPRQQRRGKFGVRGEEEISSTCGLQESRSSCPGGVEAASKDKREGVTWSRPN